MKIFKKLADKFLYVKYDTQQKNDSIYFDENGYSRCKGYSDMKVTIYQDKELETFIWVNKDKETIRTQTLTHNFGEMNGSRWQTPHLYFKIKDWPKEKGEQKDFIYEILFCDHKEIDLDDGFKEAILNNCWELTKDFIEHLQFKH